MTIEIYYKGGRLFLPDKEITFDFDIGNVIVFQDEIIIVFLIIPNDNTSMFNNIFAFLPDGQVLWRVQPINEAYPKMVDLLPYEGMAMIDEKLSATDFNGRRVLINPKTGKILSKDFVK